MSSNESLPFDIEQEQKNYNAWFNSRRICDKCQPIFDHWYEWEQWGPESLKHYHHSLDSLEQSATSCPICEMLFSDIKTMADLNSRRRFEELDRSLPGTVTIQKHILYSYLVMKLVLGTRPNPLDQRDVNLELELSLTKGIDKIKTHVGRISRTTDCAESWNLAKNWIEECNNSHDACHESLSEWRLPTRLIDVDARHCDNGCRLVLTDQLESSTSYLTLSHCWGGKVHLKLTTMNQSEFLGMTGIPFEKLSKTFQQAIYTTRKLGYRYIWIDSLCIVQDDADDWNREAAVMGQIYANSELNLAASDSPDGNTGLFFDRSERRATGWKVMCLVDANSLNTETWDCTPRYWASDITTNVLNTRGWVFQERFLVRRTLSFGSHELVWECRAKDASETFPESIKHGLETLNAIAHRFLGKKSIIPINNPVNISIGWGDVVNGYSSQALSFPNDKLVAISGVAKLFAEKYGQRYLAGMWDKDLIRQLNWSSASPGTDLRHLGRAPSWSWASTDNLVSLPRTLFGSGWHQNVVIEDIAMVPTDDPFTVCKGGSLRVRCQTLPHGIMMPYDGAPALKLAMCIYNTRIPGSGVWPDYLEEYCASQEVFYLPLLMLPPGGTETPAIFGLVLQKVSAGIYSRVGSFRVFSQEAIEGMNRVLVANEGEQAENFKDGAREESWNGPCFTIQIV